ncbi:MAG: tRNA dihydrouridine(20/20a) synthase DusA [Candidatus Sericytochromatia bacterium]|nr:tRNA dihydrouridine(20/20a) synthase DusA [Candidatus Sericytochromatia bacterium]
MNDTLQTTNNLKQNIQTYPLSVAPMMDWTDRHYRYFMRQITKSTFLYTEMVTTGAILYGDKNRLLDFSETEKPISLQLGGDNPQQLAECAKIAEDWGYSEVNLNVGCPSDRVQQGNFGACLMAKPELVALCVEKMIDKVNIPITVKHRIGIDDRHSYEELAHFVQTVADAGCKRFIVHARIALLKGLSPRDNRTVPPLRYNDVYQLKKDFPKLIIEINGGIKTLSEVEEHLKYTDGVMLGRVAYENPYIFAGVDNLFFNTNTSKPSRRDIIELMIPHIEKCLKNDIYINKIIIHMLGLFNHQEGSKIWKRHLSENMHKKNAGIEILTDVIAKIPAYILDDNIN